MSAMFKRPFRGPTRLHGLLLMVLSMSFVVLFTLNCALSSSPGRSGFTPGRRLLKKELLYKRAYGRPALAVRNSRIAYRPGRVTPVSAKYVIRDGKQPARVRAEYIVLLKPGRTDRDLLQELQSAGIPSALIGYVPTFRMVQVRVAADRKGILADLRKLPSAESVFRNHVHGRRQGFARGQVPLWYIDDYDLRKIWEKTRGKGINIAILDSGMATGLVPFKGRIRHPYSVFTNSSRFVTGEIAEGHGKFRILDHGTAVAAVAAANPPGLGGAMGVAPDATIMPIQVIGGGVSGDESHTSDMMILEGIARALAYGAHVINISLGTDYDGVFPEPGPDYRLRLRRFHRRTAAHARSAGRVYDLAFAE